MFNKLRNKFLILNIVIISVLMIISFTSIYLITYNNVKRDIDMELGKISDFSHKGDRDSNKPRLDFANDPHPERSVSFTLLLDNDWNIVKVASVFDIENEDYDNMKNIVLSKGSDTNSFKYDDTYWAFVSMPDFNGHRIVFLDITSQKNILKNLIYTFSLVALVMLIAIYFISRFFANKSIKPIEEAFDRQKQFIADASHELKTPLAVINTNIDVLLSNSGESIKSQSKWLNYIKSESERMSKLTNDLLYLTQIDYSDVKMIYSNFNLSEAVENVILTMEAVIFENNINFDYDIDKGVMIHGNSEQIMQVVMILLDNAIKYTDKKGSVQINLKKTHGNIALSVSNTGEGIPQESLDKIFNRFYRVDKSRERKTGGYGLGLAIAKAIITQHGGKIYAKSIPDEKTTFIIEFSKTT